MRNRKLVVVPLVVALIGVASAVPAATIPAAEIQPLSSAVVSKAAPSTVATQFGELLRRHAADQLSIGTVEGLLNQVLKESIQQANRDTAALLEKIQRSNEVAAALRDQMSDLNAKSQALAQLGNATETALTVAHGDRLVAAAEQLNVAADGLLGKLRTSKELDASLQLELQQALTRLQQLAQYLSQVARSVNEVIKSSLANLKA